MQNEKGTIQNGGRQGRNPRVVQEWWASLSQGERRLIWSVMKLLRGAKRSEVAEVARAAAKWERGIGCFIKVRLMSARPRGRAVESGWLRVEGREAMRTSNIQHSTSNVECGEGRKGMGQMGQKGLMADRKPEACGTNAR